MKDKQVQKSSMLMAWLLILMVALSACGGTTEQPTAVAPAATTAPAATMEATATTASATDMATATTVPAATMEPAATTAPSGGQTTPGAASSLPVAKTVPGLKAGKPYRIAVLFPNAGDPYFQQKRFGYEDEAKKTGVQVTFFDAGGYANIEKQIAQIEDATQQKFDAIAIAVTSSTATVPALEAAQKAGILVVGDGVFPESKTIIKRGEDSELAGYNAGKYLCDNLKDGGSVGLLLGPPGIDLIRLREVGVKRALSACPNVKVAKELHNLSDLVSSTQAAEDVLQSTPDVKGFYTFNSVVAQAVASSLQAAGKKPGEVLVTTVDLDPDLEKAMKAGTVQQTSVAGSVLLGRVVVDTIVQKLDGANVEMEAYLVPQSLTASDLDKFDRTILYPDATK